MIYLAIDIGGTSIKGGFYEESGNCLKGFSFPTHGDLPGTESFAAFISNLKNEVEAFADRDSIVAAGIGCPGTIDSLKGICNFANNLDWHEVNIREAIEAIIHRPVFVTNDANAALLGEMTYGDCKKYRSAILLTLGTGIGGGIYLNGELFDGEEGKGAELGHMVIVKDGEPCTCGRKGCFEAYASATALIRHGQEGVARNPNSLLAKSPVTAKSIFDAAKAGDVLANECVDWYVEYLGIGVLNYINIFRPQAIIFSGGVSNAGDRLLDPLREYLEKENWGIAGRWCAKPVLAIASLGDRSGRLGALALAVRKSK